ncbi:SMI1/KNR4 family protein [Stigmatella aurantiaca]|uniref:Knr4/Smi1-like domain-containing protein n=1 Tax=Stigmatella aurantiaca (strain DW4/3-1) TaxID=378806 RepID=E3FFW7_STIAD|nr:SMI1/KNR4 family protein [Stigmatella aurantiaca]ADO75226.1 uncharacterized protein STAUR_7470 [Stigmatella aurantiaca DW4/3-1]
MPLQPLLEEISRHHFPNPPATPEEIDEFERRVGWRLDPDLRAFYLHCNGGKGRPYRALHFLPTHDRCSYPWYRYPRDQVQPMSTNDFLEDLRKRWVESCTSSDVGLWWIADDVRQLRPEASENEVRAETLRALRPLLNQGLFRAANLLPGGSYQLWEGSVEEQLMRIDTEWATLGRPPDIGGIVWFIGAR